MYVCMSLSPIDQYIPTHYVSLVPHVHVHENKCPLFVKFLYSYLPTHVIIVTVVIILLPELAELS